MISKWLFIHIPKTGGTFFKNTLGIGESDSPVRPTRPTTVPELLARQRMEMRMRTGSPREPQNYERVENLAHAFPYHFTVDGWNPKSSKYSYMSFLKDMPYHRVYRSSYTEENDHIEYVTVVRNPFDLFYSYWRYMPEDQSDWTADTPPLGGWANCNVVMNIHSFSDFVEHYLDPEKKWHIPPLKKNLFAQLYREDGTLIPKMENILRCENLKGDLACWCDRSDIPYRDIVPMSKRNINPVPDTYEDKYTLRQVYLLEQVWEEQLKTFDYHWRD